jgi:hypothetical protein
MKAKRAEFALLQTAARDFHRIFGGKAEGDLQK